MRASIVHLWSVLLVAAALSACSGQTIAPSSAATGEASPPTGSWLQGTIDERLETVATQLGGFGITMLEVGYRYGELYFAGDDGNWDYAGYQIEEMEEAMANGLQRRPARAASAAMLDPALAKVKAAVAARDGDAFEDAFKTLTITCNACHAAENVSFIRVAPPRHRVGPIESS